LVETIQRNLNDLRRLGVKYVTSGGEPLLRSDVGQIYAGEKGFYTSMTTNTILYPKKRGKFRGWWTS